VPSVRARPRLYFGLGRADPGLPAAIARTVAAEPFGWSRDPVDVRLRIDADLTFTVIDDGTAPLECGTGRPLLDRNGCLLDRRRWALAAAAALSVRARAEVHASGRRWVQDLAGALPASPPRDGGDASGALTRVTFELDGSYFRPGSVLPVDPGALWPDAVRGTFSVTDQRVA